MRSNISLVTHPLGYRNVSPPLALHCHGGTTPAGGARTSTAYREDTSDWSTATIESELANHVRTGARYDSVSGLWLPGTVLEPAATNLCKRSEAIDNAAWTKTRCSVTNTSTTTAPDGTTTSNDVFHEDGTAASTHQLLSTTTAALVNGTTYIISFFGKAINRDWCFVALAGVGVGGQVFNVSDGTLGTAQAGIDAAGSVPYGNGWYRCWARFDSGASASGLIQFLIASASDTWTFDGLNQDSSYIWGVQLEAGEFPSSYIQNAGDSSVTRTADSALVYTLGSELSRREVSLTVPVLVPSHTPGADLDLISIYKNGAAATDHITISAEASTGKLKVTSAASGGDAGSVVVNENIADGEIHHVQVAMRNGQLHAWCDQKNHTADLVATMAGDLDRFDQKASGAWIGQVNMWADFASRPRRPIQSQSTVVAT